MRLPLVIANWKMNGDSDTNGALLSALMGLLESAGEGKTGCVICPPYPYLQGVRALIDGSGLELGAQDCSHSASGAYTGEVAAPMLADCGARWVILGHSERRQYHGESDALVAAKLAAAQAAGLTPVVCVGETREQREAGNAQQVVTTQLRGALADVANLDGIVIAYEPVWAIGTGLTATPELAQEMHGELRGALAEIDQAGAQGVRLLYGGSVKADNAASLFAQADIDGALVGGASLDAEAFAAIVSAAQETV
uniref:Triosephosphate isomerase n=1 Tax=Haliea sp. ETY-M TaxID=1055105 RepID=A0A455R1W7_9GAMM|nr:triosephosphate isomerase [Haliea sp. ETY-M]